MRAVHRFWPDYRSVWRWHFYAGLFCLPFVLWLSVTGTIYLFKPQIDALIDRPYDGLTLKVAQPPSAQARAALAAVPGSTLQAYELPRHTNDAARVLLHTGGGTIRAYVRPDTLAVLKTVPEESRFERVVFKLHGQLLLGNWGSALVELAASWAVMMIVTGLYLWWPRGAGLAGVVYPRLRAQGRVFWRDLHGVVGFWVSVFALFLLISGLPWSIVWGSALKAARQIGAPQAAQQDWPVGAEADAASSEHQGHGGMHGMHMVWQHDPATLDVLVPAAMAQHLAAPVLVMPDGTVRSDAQNRPQRATLTLDTRSGAVLTRSDFADHPVIDRAVGIGVAAHEGQLFGWANQLLGLLTTAGLALLSVSAGMLWWRRKPSGVLGAPPALRPVRVSPVFVAVLIGFCVLLPMLGGSMIAVLIVEALVLRRLPAARHWLGMEKPA